MAVNKVVYGAVSIMDISDSTVTPETLAQGATAYDKSGEKITGKMVAGEDLEAIITQQETLIQELSTTLDSKAAGGSGGGGSVETCTVTIDDNDSGALDYAYLTVYRNGVYSTIQTPHFEAGSHTITDVICNSCIVICGFMGGMPLDIVSTSNMTLFEMSTHGDALIAQAPASSGEGALRIEP